MEPACLGHGAGVPHAKLLAQTRCVCRMAAPRQEEKESTFPAERIGDMVGLLAELLQCEGLVLSELENPCSQGGQGECEDCVDSGGREGGHGLLLLGVFG